MPSRRNWGWRSMVTECNIASTKSFGTKSPLSTKVHALRTKGRASLSRIPEGLVHKLLKPRYLEIETSRTDFFISLRDIRSLPTRSVFTFFQTFLNFWSNAPKCRHLGGVCACFSKSVRKRRFRNVWVGGGIGDQIFEYRGRTFRRFRVFGPQGAPLTRARAGHQLTGLPLGAPTYCGVGAK